MSDLTQAGLARRSFLVRSVATTAGAYFSIGMPDDVILGQVDDADVRRAATIAPPPRSQASDSDVAAALAALRTAERPLVIVGKGMAWSRAEDEVRAFIDKTQLPFLNSPMGKGV